MAEPSVKVVGTDPFRGVRIQYRHRTVWIPFRYAMNGANYYESSRNEALSLLGYPLSPRLRGLPSPDTPDDPSVPHPPVQDPREVWKEVRAQVHAVQKSSGLAFKDFMKGLLTELRKSHEVRTFPRTKKSFEVDGVEFGVYGHGRYEISVRSYNLPDDALSEAIFFAHEHLRAAAIVGDIVSSEAVQTARRAERERQARVKAREEAISQRVAKIASPPDLVYDGPWVDGHVWVHAGPANVVGASASWVCSKCQTEAITDGPSPDPDAQISPGTGHDPMSCELAMVVRFHKL